MLLTYVIWFYYLFIIALLNDVFDSSTSLPFSFPCYSLSVITSHSHAFHYPLPSHYFPFSCISLSVTFALLPIPMHYSFRYLRITSHSHALQCLLPSHYLPFPCITVSATFALLPIPMHYSVCYLRITCHLLSLVVA
jgi:hypothetical protein